MGLQCGQLAQVQYVFDFISPQVRNSITHLAPWSHTHQKKEFGSTLIPNKQFILHFDCRDKCFELRQILKIFSEAVFEVVEFKEITQNILLSACNIGSNIYYIA